MLGWLSVPGAAAAEDSRGPVAALICAGRHTLDYAALHGTLMDVSRTNNRLCRCRANTQQELRVKDPGDYQ